MSPVSRLVRRCALIAAVSGSALAPAAASAAQGDPLGIACTTRLDAASVRFCEGTSLITASDGQKILDVNVTLPAYPAPGPDGNYPLVIVAHGWGGQKKAFDAREAPYIPSAKEWALRGYAVLNVTDRGFNGSCGSPQVRLANPVDCLQGFIRLDDTRYEIRDVQELAGRLADQGWIDPQRIGAVGESYGGGLSLMLGTLKDRIMRTDGTLAPWTSPNGKPMRVAGAVPAIPWSSLVSSLMPNGRDLDYALTAPGALGSPIGVEKQSFVSGLYLTGQASGAYAPPGTADADLSGWFSRINAGEPYDGDPTVADILASFTNYRSAWSLLAGATKAGADGEAPAPMLISNGFTDDLFPVDEALRYYNLALARFPQTPISLSFMDYGHQRGQNKAADTADLYDRTVAWIDFHVRGTGPDPGRYVAVRTQTCPSSAASATFGAPTWGAIHPGQLAWSADQDQTIASSGGGNPQNGNAFDPITGPGACATVSSASEPGGAIYTLPAATGAGYTMVGAPTVTAQLTVTGAFPAIAERLLDVAPDGTRTLVARGVYRPDATGLQVFQLHPGAWHFAAGHRPELQLLAQDTPYVRPSNGKFSIAVSGLRLRLPTIETSGNGIQDAGSEPLPIPVGATPAPGAPKTTTAGGPYGGGSAPPGSGKVTASSSKNPPRHPAKISVLRAGARHGRLDVLARITSRATGSLGVQYRAAGRTIRFTVPIASAAASGPRAHAAMRMVRIEHPLSGAQARKGTGIVTIDYAGNDRVRPDRVRLRAAKRKALLRRRTARIRSGHLQVSGTISRHAHGVVRIRLGYDRPDASVRFRHYHARIHKGRWSIDRTLPAEARGVGELSIQFTGYLPGRIRGEQNAKQVGG